MRAAKMEDVASLTWGLPSFQTPELIRRAVARRLDSDPEIGMYSLPDGLPQLREAAAKAHRAATGPCGCNTSALHCFGDKPSRAFPCEQGARRGAGL